MCNLRVLDMFLLDVSSPIAFNLGCASLGMIAEKIQPIPGTPAPSNENRVVINFFTAKTSTLEVTQKGTHHMLSVSIYRFVKTKNHICVVLSMYDVSIFKHMDRNMRHICTRTILKIK